MASLWKIPLVFICENNGYAISVSTKLSQSTPDVADRAQAFGMPGVIVDGNDVIAVKEAAAHAIRRARLGEGPTLLECKTVRWERHSAFSSGKYEDPAETFRWKSVDPIPRFKELLLTKGVTAEDIAHEDTQATDAITVAVDFALSSPSPTFASVFDGIFAES